MPMLTRDNAKEHCRTCLAILKTTNNFVAQQTSNEEEMPEFKDELCINIASNSELQSLIAKYVDDTVLSLCETEEFPPSICLDCYNKLQSIEEFRKRARDSVEKLCAIFVHNYVAKEKTDHEENEVVSKKDNSVLNNDDEDIYKLLLKDNLMETETVILDNTVVENLVSEETRDPDPFDTTIPIKTRRSPVEGKKTKIENETSTDNKDSLARSAESISIVNAENEKNEDEDAENSDEDDDSDDEDDDEDDDDDDDGDTDDNEEYIEGKTPRTRSANRRSTEETRNPKRKKRRTKKEMEEWRKSQGESLQGKVKRRNRGTKNSFKCEQCNHCFAHKITLDAHVRKVHEGSKRPFQCDRCDKAYTFIGGLYTHIKEIHEAKVRSYACDHVGCDRIYTSFIAMQKHKRTKHTEISHQKKYVCEQCGATFNQIGNLKYHRRSRHPTEAEQAEKEKSKERYECTICKKYFHSRYTLKYHTLQLHSNDMKFECNVCGRRMAKKFMLVQHMLVHSTDKMPCEHCGKQFIRKFELEAHIRAVHMKLKPFECQYCTECFASRKTLRHHEYIHTGEKPYVCDICGQAYRQQTCLKNHRKSHEKISADEILTANINRNLMNNYMGHVGGMLPPTATRLPAPLPPPANVNEVYK